MSFFLVKSIRVSKKLFPTGTVQWAWVMATVVGYLGHELVRVEMLGSGVSRLERLRGIIAALVGGKAQGPKCG